MNKTEPGRLSTTYLAETRPRIPKWPDRMSGDRFVAAVISQDLSESGPSAHGRPENELSQKTSLRAMLMIA